MKTLIDSTVRLSDAVYPDGEEVTGLWNVIGTAGAELVLERYGTVIRCPAANATRVDHHPTLVGRKAA